MRRITRWLRMVLLGRRDGFRARLRRRMGFGRADGPSAPAPAPRPSTAPPGLGVEAPEGYRAVLDRTSLSPGEITEVSIDGAVIAIANVDGEFFAVSNTCLHAGGPIGDGTMDGHTVTCPYHGWSYDVRDGTCFVSPDARLPTYPVRVVGDAVCVRL